ncbi:MAG: lantibiotic dehydratase [Flavobacterium sp.]
MTKIQPFGFFLLRQHLLPINELFKLDENCQHLANTEQYLRQLFSNPTLQEAIFIASPSLYGRFRAWLKGEKISESHKLLQTLFKYYLRMSSRCTPYGIFAGCSVFEIGHETKIIKDEAYPLTTHVRLDTNYLVEIVSFLLDDKIIRNQLRFYPNNTIYKVGPKYHYLFYKIVDQSRSYSICAVEANHYVSLILEKSRTGVYIGDLIEILTSDSIAKDEAEEFIEQMIAEQFLISEIEPTISGDDFLGILIDKLSTIRIDEQILNPIQQIYELLKNEGNSIEQYEKIETLLKCLLNQNHSNFLQATSFHNYAVSTIGNELITPLCNQLEKLLVLNHGNYNEDLDNFKKRFYARYEDAEVPLALVLDNEVGIGYGNNLNISGNAELIDDIPTENRANPKIISWIYWKEFSTQKYVEAIRNQNDEILLTEQDLELLKAKHIENSKSSPSTFCVFGTLFQEQNQALFHLKNLGGPSAVSMMARFANGNEVLTERLRACTDYEHQQNKEVIFAEIVHIPEARVGNVSARPKLREYEIPYQTPSTLPLQNQIPIDDIMISIVRGESIILRSKKLNKQIVPRLSSAHDYRNGISIYRFLCDLQYDNEVFNAVWHWHILSSYDFLPRVRYQNIILSPAIWNLTLKHFPSNDIDIKAMRELRDKFRIPRYVFIADGDNELFIDFDNEVCLCLLKDILIQNEKVTLKEVLANPENCLIKTSQGSFTNEVIIPFKTTAYKPVHITKAVKKHKIKREFSVGSEWIYFKVYCGEKTGDELLMNELKKLCSELLEKKVVSQCFFIRYRDPDFHIRLRFRGNPKTLFYANVISRLHDVLKYKQMTNSIHKIQIDTYRREVERYGDATIELSEELFFRDSLSVMDFLSKRPDEQSRFLFALKRIDYMLEVLEVDNKKNFTEIMQKSFVEEFGDTTELKKKLNEKYRNQSIDFTNNEFPFVDLDNIAPQILQRVSEQYKLYSLLSSYIHMLVNRLFISNNRIYELLTYHFLLKTYTKNYHLKKSARL